MFSNIKEAFLPKNTTSHTHPLDAGIIKVWKVYYKRRLLRHVSQVDGERSTSQIVKSVTLLMAVRWMVNAWEEVKGDVINTRFRHVGMYPSTMDLDDDDDNNPFAGEELIDLEALVQKMYQKGIEVTPYAAIDDDTDAYHCLDPADPHWRETLGDDVIETHTKNNKTEIEIDSDSDDGSDDAPLPISAVQTVKGALDLVRQIAEFADYQGSEEFSSAVTKVSDILVDLSLKTPKQSSILDFVEKRSMAKEW